MKDYYKILDVSKNASADEIKRAYRKLALKYHPDTGGNHNEAQFKEINEAYQVLSNAQKRAQYDQFGTVGDNPFGGGNNNGFDGSNYGWDFSGFGGGLGDIFESVFSQAFSQVQSEISITLTQALLGDKIQLRTGLGDVVDLNIPAGTQDGQTFRFKGHGQQSRRGRGDLLITVRIQYPRKLSREQKELLEQLRRTGL